LFDGCFAGAVAHLGELGLVGCEFGIDAGELDIDGFDARVDAGDGGVEGGFWGRAFGSEEAVHFVLRRIYLEVPRRQLVGRSCRKEGCFVVEVCQQI